jgi:hypothetical protein
VDCKVLPPDDAIVWMNHEVRMARNDVLTDLAVLCSLAEKSIDVSETEFFQEFSSDPAALREEIRATIERLIAKSIYLLDISMPLTDLRKREAVYLSSSPPVISAELDLGAFKDEIPRLNELRTSVALSTNYNLVRWAGYSPLYGGIDGSIAPKSAATQLNATHRILLDHLSVYFSLARLHLQSEWPTRISDTTPLCIKSARRFLGIIGTIMIRLTAEGKNKLSVPLQISSNQLFTHCFVLARIAAEVLQVHGPENGLMEADLLEESDLEKMVEAAKECLCSGLECIVHAQSALDDVGDFV